MADTGNTTQKFLGLQSTRTRKDVARGEVQIFSNPDPDEGSDLQTRRPTSLNLYHHEVLLPLSYGTTTIVSALYLRRGICGPNHHTARSNRGRPGRPQITYDAAPYGNVIVPARDTVKSLSKSLAISLRMVIETELIDGSVHEVREVMGLRFACY